MHYVNIFNFIGQPEVIPEGFDLTEKPENYRVEDSYLTMKGKRLDPLKRQKR